MNSEQGSNSDRQKSLPDQKSELPAAAESTESWFSEVFDIRVVMFLICVIVIAMTATVLLLRENVEESKPESSLPSTPHDITEGETSGTEPDSRDALVGTLSKINQQADGGFTLPLANASLEKCERTSNGISKWQLEGTAKWWLVFDDRRSGFFYCNVTYQTTIECQFGLKMGDRSARTFTLYPQDGEFTEQFIVRLDKPDAQSVRLIALGSDASEVAIKKIILVPQK